VKDATNFFFGTQQLFALLSMKTHVFRLCSSYHQAVEQR